MAKDTEKLFESIGRVLAVTPDDKLVSLLPEHERPRYRWAYDAVNRIRACDFDAMPQHVFDRVRAFVGRIDGTVGSLENWSGLDNEKRSKVTEGLANADAVFHGSKLSNESHLATGGVAQLVSYYSSNLAPLAEDAKANAKRVYNARVAAEKMSEEAKAARDDARRAASIDVAKNFAGVFKTQAENDSEAAFQWLCASGAAVVLTLVCAGGLFGFYVWAWLNASETAHAAFPIALTVGGVAILSACFYAVTFCGRTYRAHSHNSVLNRHRANALESFQAFSQGALDNEAARIAVLNYAAQAIFTPQNSGFAPGGESDGGGPAKQVFEFVSNLDK